MTPDRSGRWIRRFRDFRKIHEIAGWVVVSIQRPGDAQQQEFGSHIGMIVQRHSQVSQNAFSQQRVGLEARSQLLQQVQMHPDDLLDDRASAIRLDRIGGMDAVVQKILMNQGKRPLERQGQRRKIIMSVPVAPKFGDCSGTEKKVAGGFREIAVAQRGGQIGALGKVGPNTIDAALPAVTRPDRAPGFIDHSDPGTKELGARMPVEMSDTTGKSLRMIPIIGIEDTDEIAIFGQLETASQSHVGSLILLDDQMNPRISDGTNDFDRVIAGTIVDNHQSLGWKGLSESGANRFGDKISVIVRRDDAGDFLAHS